MAEEQLLELSVRALVEFTYHGEDIRPGGSLRDMREGMLGHQGRQALLAGEQWQTEVPLLLEELFPDTNQRLRLRGRMDAFLPGDVPVIEEIKLWQPKTPPEEADPAHIAQAIVYGHMLCENQGTGRVSLRVSYVRRTGKLVAEFRRDVSAAECRDAYRQLLEPYVRRQTKLYKHRAERDHSLMDLQFPYDAYRPGQRDMAAQVYTAIRLHRRLFASLPTGTGKSAASLFPALKALGLGLTNQVYYLTARTTQRQGPLEALRQMRSQHPALWTLVLDAKDKQCPGRTICHPDYCPRAKGHYLRDTEAIEELLRENDWTPERIREISEQYRLCPFELSLSLAELADLVICDYNYALDPAVHIQRIFDRQMPVTLLIDEAHNLLDRTREMLGGRLDTASLRLLRRAVGKIAGRKHALYTGLTKTLQALAGIPPEGRGAEGRLSEVPASLTHAAEQLSEAILDARQERLSWGDASEIMADVTGDLMSFLRSLKREKSGYAWIWQGRKQTCVTALALDVSAYLQEVTACLCGVICFSATMDPLPDMKLLLGGDEEDACFSAPSPFPPENLQVIRKPINTRYSARQQTASLIAEEILHLTAEAPGKYLIYFPSFAYLDTVAALLPSDSFPCQKRSMTDAERADFLAPYHPDGPACSSLCVLGGIFSEAIDLPGKALDGVIIVSVGLPTADIFRETLRAYYEERFGAGFAYAYMLPGLQKVAQAAGRVIRSEEDKGIVALLDDRYFLASYKRMLPAYWRYDADL